MKVKVSFEPVKLEVQDQSSETLEAAVKAALAKKMADYDSDISNSVDLQVRNEIDSAIRNALEEVNRYCGDIVRKRFASEAKTQIDGLKKSILESNIQGRVNEIAAKHIDDVLQEHISAFTKKIVVNEVTRLIGDQDIQSKLLLLLDRLLEHPELKRDRP